MPNAVFIGQVVTANGTKRIIHDFMNISNMEETAYGKKQKQ